MVATPRTFFSAAHCRMIAMCTDCLITSSLIRHTERTGSVTKKLSRKSTSEAAPVDLARDCQVLVTVSFFFYNTCSRTLAARAAFLQYRNRNLRLGVNKSENAGEEKKDSANQRPHVLDTD